MPTKKATTASTDERVPAAGNRAANQRVDAQRNRAKILAAAVTAIRKNPDASVADIAAEAGVGRMTLYGHFKTRPELIEAALVESLDRAENVLAFGNPGTGKTHLLCALGQELVRSGRAVLFAPTFQIVQRLLAAKRDLRLPSELKKLDRFDALLLDDIGYVQQSREEMEVLFTLLAERYERKSVVITSNLVFSQWEQIFKDPLTTAAVIDRVVHHARILEFGSDMLSMRAEVAAKRQQQELLIIDSLPSNG